MKRTTILLGLLLGMGVLLAQNRVIGHYPNQQLICQDSLVGDSVHTLFMDETGVVFQKVVYKKPLVSGGIKVIRADHAALLKIMIPHIHKLTFSPAIQQGKTITCWTNLPFLFAPSEQGQGTSVYEVSLDRKKKRKRSR